jgi:uncharacterized protein (TIGR02391 family)
LLFAAILVVWLGLAGPIFSDAAMRGWYDVLKDWQTLLAALTALAAALIAARPVWKQLAIGHSQTLQRSYEQLSERSLHLHKEREALYNLTSAIDIMVKALAALPDLNPIGGITADIVLSVVGPHNYLTETVKIYKSELGPVWGSAARAFPKSLLHPSIADKVYPYVMRGELDEAVFAAFKAVEVAVRAAGNYGPRDIGVPLMRLAFDANNGPLTDYTQPHAEREALCHLFAGAIGSYKNPHSHRTVALTDPREAQQQVMLATHLLSIVDARRQRP